MFVFYAEEFCECLGTLAKSTGGNNFETENHVPFRKINKKCRARTLGKGARKADIEK